MAVEVATRRRVRPSLPAWRIVSESIAAQRRIPIRECGEPMVDLREVCPEIVLGMSPQRIAEQPSCVYLRATPAQMLKRAAALLPDGYRLRVGTAHRSLATQARGYWNYYMRLRREHPNWPEATLRRWANDFFHPPDVPESPPGHCTGGAVDVSILGPDGEPLDMVSPLKDKPYARYTYVPGLSPEAQRNRDLLIRVMSEAGFSNYRGEWWHWSYGDICWALRTGQLYAIYGLIAPGGTLEEVKR